MPQNHGVSTAPKQTKAQRQAEQRAAQLEAFKKREAAQKRGRVLTIVLSILAAVAVVVVVGVSPPGGGQAVATTARPPTTNASAARTCM